MSDQDNSNPQDPVQIATSIREMVTAMHEDIFKAVGVAAEDIEAFSKHASVVGYITNTAELVAAGWNGDTAALTKKAAEIALGALAGAFVASLAVAAGIPIGSAIIGAAAAVFLGKYIDDNWTKFHDGSWFNDFVKNNSTGFLNFADTFGNFINGIEDGVANAFKSFSNSPQRSDPFTLDLNGNGIDTVGISTTNPILFDIDADGVKTSTGWIAATDGLLVLDRNGNGTIDNGRELFGDATLKSNGQLAADGFDAIADQDTNHDGIISSLDTNWNNLRVWRDLNQDGISQANELVTLNSLGIASINVTQQEHNSLLDNGNVLADLGTFTYTSGTSGTAGTAANLADVNLVQDTFTSEFTDHIPLTTQAATLPDLQGSGQVRDLQEAASLSPTLATLLTQFATASRADQHALMDQILKAWSDTSTMATTFTGAYAGHNLTVDMQAWYTGIATGSAAYQARAPSEISLIWDSSSLVLLISYAFAMIMDLSFRHQQMVNKLSQIAPRLSQ